MYRDEAWHFLRIGRSLERADMTTRILDVRSSDLLPDADEIFESRSLESVQWISILKSLSCAQPWKEADVFFKHEDAGAGPRLAQRFRELFGSD